MKHSMLISLFLVSLFVVSHVIGLSVIQSYMTQTPEGVEWKPLPSIAGVEIERPEVAPEVSIWYIAIAVLIGTLLILLIIKLGKTLLWKLWFLFAVVLCLTVSLYAFLPAMVAFLFALVFGLMKVFRPNVYVHNVTEVLMYGGLAAIFVPILNVMYSAILLVLLSIYDMYAVWHSKHMVAMAKFQTKSGMFAGLLLPYAVPSRGKPKVRTAVLGGGDIGFPLIFSGAVLVQYGFTSALIVSAGAALALGILLYFSQKDKFYPAMPFLTAGCALGFVIALM